GQKVTQMIDREGRLYAIDGETPPFVDTARVVHEDVEAIMPGPVVFHQVPDRRLYGKVTEQVGDVRRAATCDRFRCGTFGSGRVTADHDDMRAAAGQLHRRSQANSARGAGHQDLLIAHVPHVRPPILLYRILSTAS